MDSPNRTNNHSIKKKQSIALNILEIDSYAKKIIAMQSWQNVTVVTNSLLKIDYVTQIILISDYKVQDRPTLYLIYRFVCMIGC